MCVYINTLMYMYVYAYYVMTIYSKCAIILQKYCFSYSKRFKQLRDVWNPLKAKVCYVKYTGIYKFWIYRIINRISNINCKLYSFGKIKKKFLKFVTDVYFVSNKLHTVWNFKIVFTQASTIKILQKKFALLLPPID